MRVVIFGPLCSHEDGLNTIVRSEGRFALLWADILVRAAHDVFMASHSEQDRDGVHFRNVNTLFGLRFDVALFVEYSPADGWEKNVVALRKIFAHFNPPSPEVSNLLPIDAVIVTPLHPDRIASFSVRRKGFLPYMVYEELGPSKFYKKGVISTCRYPFNCSLSEEIVLTNIKHFQALLAVKDAGYPVMLLGLDDKDIHPVASQFYQYLVEALRNERTSLLPHREFLKLIGNFSIAIVGFQSSSSPDLVMSGLVPLVWEDHGYLMFDNSLKQSFGGFTYSKLSQETIRDRIFRLLEDEKQFSKELSIVRRSMLLCSELEALDYFYKLIA